MNDNNAYGAGATTHLVAREAAKAAAQSRYIPGTTLADPVFSLSFGARDPRFPSVVKYPSAPGQPVLVAQTRAANLTTGVNQVYVPAGIDQRATVLPSQVSNAPGGTGGARANAYNVPARK